MVVVLDLTEKEIEKLREEIGGDAEFYEDSDNVAYAIHTLIEVAM